MTKRERLQEEYEDALFALLMNDYLDELGKQALEENERLQQSGEVVVPPEMDKRIRKTIATYRPPRRPAARRKMKTALRRVAIAACAAVCITGTAFAASPSFRAYVLGLVTTVEEKSTEFHFTYDGSDVIPADYVDSEIEDFTIGWIPDDFTFEKEERYFDQISYSFYTVDDRRLVVEKFTGSGTTFAIDTEDAVVTYEQIHGKTATVSEKDTYVILTWAEPENATFYCVTGEGVDKEDIIKIANNIQETNQED